MRQDGHTPYTDVAPRRRGRGPGHRRTSQGNAEPVGADSPTPPGTRRKGFEARPRRRFGVPGEIAPPGATEASGASPGGGQPAVSSECHVAVNSGVSFGSTWESDRGQIRGQHPWSGRGHFKELRLGQVTVNIRGHIDVGEEGNWRGAVDGHPHREAVDNRGHVLTAATARRPRRLQRGVSRGWATDPRSSTH